MVCVTLFIATSGGYFDIVKYLAEEGRLRSTRYNWNELMLRAAFKGHKDLVKFFIDKGADNFGWGMTEATRGGHLDLVKFFADKGADAWNLALKLAVRNNHQDLVEYFMAKGTHYFNRELYEAVRDDRTDVVKELVDEGDFLGKYMLRIIGF